MGSLLQDLRYGWRMLLKAPGFTLVAIVTLALGIGANVAIFGFVDELWLRPMPVPEANRVVRVFTSNPRGNGEVERGWSSYPDFEDMRSRSKTLSGLALMERRGALYDDGTQTTLVTAAVLSNNFFDVLQPTPAVGRTFTEAELKNSQALPVMLSYPFWKRAFNGDKSRIGRTFIVDRLPVLALGVLPRSFRGTEAMQVPDLWIPMATWLQFVPGERGRLTSRRFRDYELFGRLQPGVSLEQAKAELATTAAALAQSYPETNAGRKMIAVQETDTRGDWVASVGLALLAVAALVLLIACANVASLLLARAEHRRREIATRVALGATPRHIVRQLLSETVLLAAAGTVAALLVGNYVLQVLPALLPQTVVPVGVDAYLSVRGIAFALSVAFASLFLFGLFPAFQSSQVAPASVLKQFGIQASARRRLRSVLVAGQVALSLVAIVSAGLLIRSVGRALETDPGFNAHQNMLILEVLPAFGHRSEQDSQNFVVEARRRLESLPGVAATSIAMRFPFGMSGSGATQKVFVADSLTAGDRDGVTINYDSIGDRYFQVLGTRVLKGRGIEPQDLRNNARVVVVNERLASRFWPQGDAVGRQIRLDKPDSPPYEVVGVAENSTYNDFQEDPMPYLYIPMASDDYGEVAMAVQTKGDPGALADPVRRTLRDINRGVPITGMLSMREQVREALYGERLTAMLTVSLGILALLLASIGIYGLMSFLVERRTQEIGIRLALGARRGEVLVLILRYAIGVTTIGIAVGIAGSYLATKTLSSLLFGVRPTDLLVMGGAVLVLVCAAFAATIIPALQASRVDPMVALRYE